jgi:hypothetical protein
MAKMELIREKKDGLTSWVMTAQFFSSTWMVREIDEKILIEKAGIL